jgi:Arc/MetJ-type ribon-helix-helix transcriptional regulator
VGKTESNILSEANLQTYDPDSLIATSHKIAILLYMLDRSVNVRLPQDLLHRLEKQVAEYNARRSQMIAEGRERLLPEHVRDGFTMSDAIRRALEKGLAVIEGDPDALEDLFLEHFSGKLEQLLARASMDRKSSVLLAKIAARAEPVEFDFG